MKYLTKEGSYIRMGVTIRPERVTFTFEGRKEQQCNVVLYEKCTGGVERITVPEGYCVGSLRSIEVQGLDTAHYDYNYEIDGEILVDPYARRIVGREHWGESARYCGDYQVRSGFSESQFEWGDEEAPEIAREDMVMYKLHVREFTMEGSNGGARKGTFEAVQNRLPYLKELGITTVELMPVYEFEELVLPSQPKLPDYITWKAEYENRETAEPVVEKLNCWGYSQGNYFAPKAAFAKGVPEDALKSLVKAMHGQGLECIMEMYFPDSMNQNLILDVLRFWVMEYHVDGFHLLGSNLPLRAMAQDLVLSRSKLFADNFPEDLLNYDYGYPHLFVYRDEFLYPVRKMLNQRSGNLNDFVNQMRKQKKYAGFVNYVASNNGFTLADLFRYSEKHNEENGENNTDGSDWNYSSNYGVEGDSRKKYVQNLRHRQMMNAVTIVALSQSVPLFYAGDEIGNSKKGNNNTYCQDNKTGWVNWGQEKRYEWLREYLKQLLTFRREHLILRLPAPMQMHDYKGLGYPDLSLHGDRAWATGFEVNRQSVGMMYCGKYAQDTNKGREADDMIYAAYNFHTGKQFLALPLLPKDRKWYKVVDTGHEHGFLQEKQELDAPQLEIAGMSVQILIGKQVK